MAMATRAYWLMGLLYPTAEVGRLFIWLLFLKTEIERNIYYRTQIPAKNASKQ